MASHRPASLEFELRPVPPFRLNAWYRMAAGDQRLRLLANRFLGMKPPRFPTMFEAIVNAFACQQLSLEVGLELLNRLAAISGAKFGTGPDAGFTFPNPHDVVKLRPENYRAVGFSRQKVRALLDLARAISRRDLDLETISGESDAFVRQRLLELRGVGRWTAEYVLLRPALLRTACSGARNASSMAACSAACRRSTTTLGSPLSTTFTLQTWSTPPRGPCMSVTRTLTRSIDVANFPSESFSSSFPGPGVSITIFSVARPIRPNPLMATLTMECSTLLIDHVGEGR